MSGSFWHSNQVGLNNFETDKKKLKKNFKKALYIPNKKLLKTLNF